MTTMEALKMLWADRNRDPNPSDPADYYPGLQDLQETADARGEIGPLNEIYDLIVGKY